MYKNINECNSKNILQYTRIWHKKITIKKINFEIFFEKISKILIINHCILESIVYACGHNKEKICIR